MAALYTGKKALVTGGTGSIGRELTTQLLASGVEVVRVLSNDENGLFEMQQHFGDERIRYLLGDVRDPERMKTAAQNIEVVFHAAALKHVPIGEYNPFEFVITNVIGTKNVIDACLYNDVENFVLISTDKAVNPVNTMGASKLLCEKLVVDSTRGYKGQRRTNFTCVRFGNVLKTRGSVTEVFTKQLAKGGPLIVTDPEMTRFVLSQETAVARVLKATKFTEGEILVMKMKALRIIDLAEAIIEEYAGSLGYDPSLIRKQVTGARPGEKIHEELMTEIEASGCYETDEFFVIPPYAPPSDIPQTRRQPAKLPYTSREGPHMTKEEIRNLLRLTGAPPQAAGKL